MAETKKNSPSQLAKTQKIGSNYETRIIPPGTKDAEARKLIEEYEKVYKTLLLIRRFSPLNPIIFLLIKKRLKGLVQQEFELYKSFPDLVKKENRTKSTEIVSSAAQAQLSSISKSVSSKLNDSIKRKMLERKYMQEVYTFKLPPLKMPAKTKKFKSVFTSSAMKKKFS